MIKAVLDWYNNLKFKWNRDLPVDVLFLDHNGNYMTRNSVRSSKSVRELIELDRLQYPEDYTDD